MTWPNHFRNNITYVRICRKSSSQNHQNSSEHRNPHNEKVKHNVTSNYALSFVGDNKGYPGALTVRQGHHWLETDTWPANIRFWLANNGSTMAHDLLASSGWLTGVRAILEQCIVLPLEIWRVAKWEACLYKKNWLRRNFCEKWDEVGKTLYFTTYLRVWCG